MRELCPKCLQPLDKPFSGCYCPEVKAFDPGIQFIILIHPIEAKKKIASGRMAHLHLINSHIFRGKNFADHVEVTRIVNDPKNDCYILYPGTHSIPIETHGSKIHKSSQNTVVFVIDGTWTTASKMIRHSPQIANLPRLSFEPTAPSRFRVRKQPQPHCLSTIEAIHQFLTKLNGPLPEQDILMTNFDRLVERQIQAIEWAQSTGRFGVRQ